MPAVVCKGEPLRQNEYVAGGEIKIGEFVALNGSGQVVEASATGALAGVAASYASGAGVAVLVWDHPDQQFIALQDSTNISAQTACNLNYSLDINTGGTREGDHRIDSDTGATDSNLPIKVLALAKEIGNAFGSTNSKLVCKINNHALAGGTGTLGV